jgi:hypothetical protein
MSTYRVKVVDSTFSHNPAIGYAGERQGEKPRHFEWDTSPGTAEVKVFTDIRLQEALDDPSPRKIALLLECPAVNSGMYEWVMEHRGVFDTILTHQETLVRYGKPFRFYPFGGSWIKEWGIFPKRDMISMLVSEKGLTEGHKLRHDAAKLSRVHAYGKGVWRYVESKAQALRDYRFAIIIENDCSDWWFTEKLIDCLSQGTIPLYRGCPDIGVFFNPAGIIRWRDIEELEAITESLTEEDYEMRRVAIEDNLRRARRYQCAEDWIVERYGGLLW